MSAQLQQINLYLPELRPRRNWLTARRLVSVAGILLIVMTVTAGWMELQTTLAQSRMDRLQVQIQEQTLRVEQVERETAARATDQALVQEMNARELRLTQSRDLYEFMRSTELGNLAGFSGYLMDLSRASFQGIWLSEIRIRGDASYVYLSGSADMPAMLPDYVSRLSMGRSDLRTKRFNRLQSTRTTGEREMFDFVLESGQ
jgi:hypothetical protein